MLRNEGTGIDKRREDEDEEKERAGAEDRAWRGWRMCWDILPIESVTTARFGLVEQLKDANDAPHAAQLTRTLLPGIMLNEER